MDREAPVPEVRRCEEAALDTPVLQLRVLVCRRVGNIDRHYLICVHTVGQRDELSKLRGREGDQSGARLFLKRSFRLLPILKKHS